MIRANPRKETKMSIEPQDLSCRMMMKCYRRLKKKSAAVRK
jgi:hypothetical protein